MNKFSVSDCLRVGVLGVIDNFRLFFLMNLIVGFFVVAILLGAGIINWSVVTDLSAVSKQQKAQAVHTVQEVTSSVVQEAEAAQPLTPIKLNVYTRCKGAACTFMQNGAVYLNILHAHWKLLSVSLLIVLLLLLGLGLGFAKGVLDYHDTGTACLSTLFSQFGRSPKVLIAAILYMFVVALGFSAFIIPGIILMFRFSFFVLAIADKNAGIIQSLSMSFAMTRGYTWHLVCLALVIGAINSLSCIMIICWPIALLTQVAAYRRLYQGQ